MVVERQIEEPGDVLLQDQRDETVREFSRCARRRERSQSGGAGEKERKLTRCKSQRDNVDCYDDDKVNDTITLNLFEQRDSSDAKANRDASPEYHGENYKVDQKGRKPSVAYE